MQESCVFGKRNGAFLPQADDLFRLAGAEAGLQEKLLAIFRVACMDQDGSVRKMNVVEGVDQPLLVDDRGGLKSP
ncbi:MAG: hypothetical protein V1736_06505 [Pseudomonadota bacterium]